MFLQRGTFLRLYYRIIVCRDPPLCGWNQEVSCAALSVDLVSKSGFLLTADPWKIGSVSKSGFLLTADPWKIGSVSKLAFLLTASHWKPYPVSKSGFLLTDDPWKTGSVSKSAFLLTASSRSDCTRRKAAWMSSGTYPGYSGNDYAETRGIGFEEILFPQNS